MADLSRFDQFGTQPWQGLAPGSDRSHVAQAYIMRVSEVYGVTHAQKVVRAPIDDCVARFEQADGKDR